MDREKILELSRREHGGRDLAQLETAVRAWDTAGRVGALVCCLVSLIPQIICDIFLLSPWVIYFSMMGTSYLVRYTRLRRGTDLVLTIALYAMCLAALIALILRLRGVRE